MQEATGFVERTSFAACIPNWYREKFDEEAATTLGTYFLLDKYR